MLRPNNTSGFCGVTWHKKHENFVAQIMVDRQQIHIGAYSTAQRAAAAYRVAKALLTQPPKLTTREQRARFREIVNSL